MKRYASILSACLLSASALMAPNGFAETQAESNAEARIMTQNTAPSNAETCGFQADFSDVAEIATWRVLLDGVMGGRSTGVRYPEDQHMTFKGAINTNGGGFSSLRKPMQPGALKDAETLKVRLKSDGRAYKLTFRTNARQWRRAVSYQLDIPQTPKGEWRDVTLPLTGFRTSIFGRRVSAPPFDAAQVREMGIILADGIDGDFELNISAITCPALKET